MACLAWRHVGLPNVGMSTDFRLNVGIICIFGSIKIILGFRAIPKGSM